MMERTQKQTKNLTEGSPARLILEFAVPMFLGLLFQQFYSMVDTMIVGKFLGMKPLAGVGATGSLNFMVIGFCIGVCNGFAIPVAQKLGAKDYSALRRFVANATWLCLAFSVVMTVIVSILCGDILRFMKTPEDIFSYTYWYMLIIFLGIPCTFLYNILAALIRSLGDSKTPVIFLALASVLNIGLDLVFIIVFRMGVKGAALATVLAQGISGLCCLWYIGKRFPILRGTKEEWKPLPKYMIRLCAVGIPMGMQYSITAIGTLVIQAAVNGFGSTVVAGVTAATKLGNFVSCPIEALGQTMAPYVGQNMGAGNTERAKKTFHYSLKMCTLFLLILGFIFSRRPVSQTMVSFFSTDAKVIPLAADYLSIIAFWCFTNAFYNVSQGLFQGCGHTLITMLVDASRIWLFRLLSLWICANVFHMGVASVWYSVVISNGTSAIILYLLYWTGIWKKGYADPL